jgi:hypothetical protein
MIIKKLLTCSRYKIYIENSLPTDVKESLYHIADILLKMQTDFGKELNFTSWYRDDEHIKAMQRDGLRPAVKGYHRSGDAVDIKDQNNKLYDWLTENNEVRCNRYGVFLERKKYTPSWCHIQTKPFGSYKQGGTRIFDI